MRRHFHSRNGPLATLVLAAATIIPTGIASAGPTLADGIAGAVGASSPHTPAAPREQADFNGDDLPDLAVGVPGMITGDDEQGAVVVLYGTARGGISPTGSQLFTETTADVGAAPHGWDLFGWTLAVGDFDGDGFDDLAAAAPGASVGGVPQSGAVIVVYGSADGLGRRPNQLFTQQNLGLLGNQTEGGIFGGALAAGDLGGSAADELTIGAYWADVGTRHAAGLVAVLYGAAGGLTTGQATQAITQDTPGVGSFTEPFDNFGAALTIGNIDGGTRDLVIGAPSETVGHVGGAGTVHVLFGTPEGITGIGSAMFHQGVTGIGSEPEDGDRFAQTLATGDFDADGHDDLAVGAPGESVGAVRLAGAVNVIYAAPGGLNTGRVSQLFTQGTTGIGSDPELEDEFGFALAAGDFDGDGADDLAVGVQFESVGTSGGAGVVHTVYGVPGGFLNAGRASQMPKRLADDLGQPAESSSFGWAVAVADLDGDGLAELIVGAPGESSATNWAVGAVHILPGTTAGITSTGTQVFHQALPGIPGDPGGNYRFGESLGAS
jgi:hypothetical protein